MLNFMLVSLDNNYYHSTLADNHLALGIWPQRVLDWNISGGRPPIRICERAHLPRSFYFVCSAHGKFIYFVSILGRGMAIVNAKPIGFVSTGQLN